MRAAIAGVLLLLLWCATSLPASATVTASLDSSQIAAGDTVQLTLQHSGDTSDQPDLSPLQQDFDILGTSTSTEVEIVNGSASEHVDVVLTLAPKRGGHLTIPSLSWDGERTQPLPLTVTGAGGLSQPASPGATAAGKVFIETSVDPERPYVQAAVRLTVRLFTSETLYQPDLELPESGDVLAKRIGSDQESNAERNGRSYQVVTRQYLLFPLRSGALTLPGPVLDAEVAVSQPQSPFGSNPFGGFFGGGMLQTVRPIRLHGPPLTLSVRTRPAGARGSYWLPARQVTLTARWDPSGLEARAGDPVTLDLDLQATGLTAAQLPDFSTLLSLPPGLKAYPDRAKLDDTTQGATLVGSRDQTIALIADTPGHYRIPSVTVSWWDTQANQPRVATLPARTLTILPAPGAPAVASAPPKPAAPPSPAKRQHATPSSTTSPVAHGPAASPRSSEWQWISLGLGIVWLATIGGWLWSRHRGKPIRVRRQSPAPAAPSSPIRHDSAAERAAFRAACANSDPLAARRHLLAWAGAAWGAAPSGLHSLAATLGDARIAELLRDLDRACYAGGNWDGQPLLEALANLPARSGKGPRGRDGLAPLYP